MITARLDIRRSNQVVERLLLRTRRKGKGKQQQEEKIRNMRFVHSHVNLLLFASRSACCVVSVSESVFAYFLKSSVSRIILRYSTVVLISPLMLNSLIASTMFLLAISLVSPMANKCPNCESLYS